MSALARRGPYQVMRGDLGVVGMPGQIFTPATGRGLPALAVAHTWLADSSRYRDLLYHLASWGFVTAAPDANSGFLASDVGLAGDLRATLDVVTNIPLGFGAVTVDPDRVGLLGHGFGAAAAMIAASSQPLGGHAAPAIAGLAAVFPAPTTSVLLPAAALVDAPGLIVCGSDELETVDSNALTLAQAYGGDVALRTVPKGNARDLLERRTVKAFVGRNGSDRALHGLIRSVCTGFLLHTVAGHADYAPFGDPAEPIGKLGGVDLADPPAIEVDPISRLLGAKPRKRRTKTG